MASELENINSIHDLVAVIMSLRLREPVTADIRASLGSALTLIDQVDCHHLWDVMALLHLAETLLGSLTSEGLDGDTRDTVAVQARNYVSRSVRHLEAYAKNYSVNFGASIN